MAGFVRLLSPDKDGNTDPNAPFFGSGWYIGDGLILTAGHVVYTFNEEDHHVDRAMVHLSQAETSSSGYTSYSLSGFQFYDYVGTYLAEAAGYADPLPAPSSQDPSSALAHGLVC